MLGERGESILFKDILHLFLLLPHLLEEEIGLQALLANYTYIFNGFCLTN